MNMSNPKIIILNGPNLNMLGTREPEHYGRSTLSEIEYSLTEKAKTLGLSVTCKQSNNEGELVSWIQEASTSADGLILNAGAYTHTSVAILDAIRLLDFPVIEVHLSNIYSREPFRRKSLISEAVTGIIAGFGMASYDHALEALANILRTPEKA